MYAVAIFIFLTFFESYSASQCEIYVDITDGSREGTNIIKDSVIYTSKDYFRSGDLIYGCICDVRPCVRKCCLKDEILNLTTRTCVSAASNARFEFSTYNIVNVPENEICDDTEVRIRIHEDFSVVDGVLVWDDLRFALEDYCLALTEDNQTFALACVENQDTNPDKIITSLGMIISMPFLLITFVVYALLPESNIHRKALMCYVLTLLIGYVILVGVQLNEQRVEVTVCHLLGYGIVYFFIASFFWMNVMCVDMWLAFSGMRGFKGKKSTERKRFLIYCGYAFGVPLILILVIFLANTYGNNKSIFHPHLGISKCFLDDGYPNLLYFYLPMAIIIGINVTLFILTALKIQKVKNETSMLHQSDSKRHSYEEDKQKFNLYLKLLFAMGINWTMEVISWAVGWAVPSASTYIWYLTDFANASYGVFIFFIFVFKRKIWITLKKRYYNCIGKPHLAHALSTSTRQTRTSHYSTTDTTVSTDYRLSDMKNGKAEERPLNRN